MCCSQKINSEARLPGRPLCVKKMEPRLRLRPTHGKRPRPSGEQPVPAGSGKGSVLRVESLSWQARGRVGGMPTRGGGCNIGRSWALGVLRLRLP